MMANSPESRTLQRAAERFWWCGLSLNLLKDVFSISLHPLDLREYMLSQKLLVDVGIDMFASEN
jgi:hypothetical protein